MLQKGELAPDFTAVTTDGSTMSLHEYRGRSNVVLFFYPEDDTSGCTREACGFRDARPDYDAANTAIFGVSLDDQASHKAFTDKFSLNFPLLVDSDRAICNAYGVPVNGHQPKRTTFLIDIEGRIAKVWEKVDTHTHAADVMEEVRGMEQAGSAAG